MKSTSPVDPIPTREAANLMNTTVAVLLGYPRRGVVRCWSVIGGCGGSRPERFFDRAEVQELAKRVEELRTLTGRGRGRANERITPDTKWELVAPEDV